jgi:hypothetical protein
MTQALAELDALSARAPGARRFAEHAFQLARIVRRFLEATSPRRCRATARPSSCIHLEAARLSART